VREIPGENAAEVAIGIEREDVREVEAVIGTVRGSEAEVAVAGESLGGIELLCLLYDCFVRYDEPLERWSISRIFRGQ